MRYSHESKELKAHLTVDELRASITSSTGHEREQKVTLTGRELAKVAIKDLVAMDQHEQPSKVERLEAKVVRKEIPGANPRVSRVCGFICCTPEHGPDLAAFACLRRIGLQGCRHLLDVPITVL